MKRPLVPVALCYGGGLLLAEVSQPPLLALFSASFALLALAALWPRARVRLLWPLLLLAGWTNLVCHTAVISPGDLRLPTNDTPAYVTMRGALRGTPSLRGADRDTQESDRTLAQLQLTGVLRGTNWQEAVGRIIVTTPGALGEEFFAGQTVEIDGVLAPPQRPVAEGLFDYRAYLARQGIYRQLRADSTNAWRLVPAAGASPLLSDRFLRWARTALALGLPVEDESLRLERALTLGEKTVLTEQISEPFVRAATYHIFAVDGLRMAILFAIFFTLFRTLQLPRALCAPLLIPLIWFYTALTGWPASAIRATVMLTIVIVGWALKRPSDLINSLFAAAIIILVCDPQQLFQAGFQLSFLVVLGIILMLPAFDRLSRRWLAPDPLLPGELRPRWQRLFLPPARYLLDLSFTSLAAWLGSIPLVAYYFHIVTPVSTPANVVAVPLCALVLTSNLISLLLAGWFPGAAHLFNHAGWFLMECIRVTSHWFAAWPGAFFYVPPPDLFTISLYYLILLAVCTGWLFRSRWRAWRIAGLVLSLFLWGLQWQHARSATSLTVLPLRGGHSVFVDNPGRADDWLIDCGNTNAVDLVVKPFLRARGVNRLPQLALTHGDLRHVGGVPSLSAAFDIGRICASPVRFRSSAYRRILDDWQPDRVRILSRGDQVGCWRILHPAPGDHFLQADDNALVLLAVFHHTRVLLLSDLGRPGQNALVERTPELRADIVIAGLPAGSEALSEGLVATISPQLIIVADSEFPATSRPTPALQERLSGKAIPVVYTRTAGAVTLTFNHSGWALRSMDGRQLAGRCPEPISAAGSEPQVSRR